MFNAAIQIPVIDDELDPSPTMLSEPFVATFKRVSQYIRASSQVLIESHTRSALEKRLYGWGEEIASNALEVHIHHLRRKLGPEFIKTVRGVGYKVDAT